MVNPATDIIDAAYPSSYAEIVTPAASDLPAITRGIYVPTSGNVTVVMAGKGNLDSNTVTFNSVPAGVILPIRVRQITAAPANTIALY